MRQILKTYKNITKMIKKSNSKQEQKTKFIAVDLWQKEFSPISVKAVCELYAQKMNLKLSNVNQHSFPKYLNALRVLEQPDYIPPNYGTGIA